jgi:drug/metabolite transporter (DMT)-like permease
MPSVSTNAPAAAAPARASLTAEGTNRNAFEPIDWLLFIGPALIWGTSFLFIHESLKHFAPGVVTFGRIALGFASLAVIPKARAIKIERADWPRVIAMGVSWLAFPMTLFPLAQQHIASGLAGMLNGSITVFSAIVATLFLRRLPGRSQLMGLSVGVLGVVLLGIPSVGRGSSSAIGVLLVIVACCSYGVATNLAVPLTQKYGSVPVFWRAQGVSVLLTAPFGLFGLTGGRSSWNLRSAVSLLALGVLGTAFAFVMMTQLGSRVGSTRSASLTYVEAVFALIIGVLVANEPVVGLEIVGCAVLLVGAWLTSRADRARS